MPSLEFDVAAADYLVSILVQSTNGQQPQQSSRVALCAEGVEHCLCYSVSIALCGQPHLWHCIRLALYEYMAEMEPKVIDKTEKLTYTHEFWSE